MRQQACVGEAGELVFRRRARHRDGPFGQAPRCRRRLRHWWTPWPAGGRPARAGRDRRLRRAPIPPPRPSRTSMPNDIERRATASAASAPAARAAFTSRSARSVSGDEVEERGGRSESLIVFHMGSRGAVQPPNRDNLDGDGNTSSIMVCNVASIIPSRNTFGYGRLTQNIKRIRTPFCHVSLRDQAHKPARESLRRQMRSGGCAGSGRDLRLDPFGLPVRFCGERCRGRWAGARYRAPSRARCAAALAAGMRMALNMPVAAYAGISLCLLPAKTARKTCWRSCSSTMILP